MVSQAGTTEALVYVRVSTDKQERDGTSLDAQLTDCRRYVRQHSWLLGQEYKDVLSGRRTDRPGYQALLAEVRRLRKAGQQVVVVAELDRLGRRLLEQVRAREELTELGVPVHFVREGGVLPDLTANLLASVAQDEAARTSRRVREGRAYTASRGFRSVGRGPWGYVWDDATDDERRLGSPRRVLRPDPDAAPFVREAFRRIAEEGASIRQVAAWIKTLPSEARGGRQLGYRNVQSAVRTPVYVGRGETPADVPVLERPRGQWSALVDDTTWTRVQDRIASHARTPRQASGSYLLTGLIRCPRCGLRMQGWKKPHHNMYTCSMPGKGCYFAARVSTIDGAILDQVGARLQPLVGDLRVQAGLRVAWARLVAPRQHDDQAKQVRALEQTIVKARTRLDAAMDRLLDGTITKDEYDRVRERHAVETEAAIAELARLQTVAAPPTLPSLDTVMGEASSWQAVLSGSDIPAQRDVLALLVERIVPQRVGWGLYNAQIDWTSLGRVLGQILEVTVAA